MSFWDSSALVPLLTDEPKSNAVRERARDEREMIVWWGTEVECASALARQERDAGGGLDFAPGWQALHLLAGTWTVISPVPQVRSTAMRLLRQHPLRAADALQLAAALVASQGDPQTLQFLTLDQRLAAAARREGLAVITP